VERETPLTPWEDLSAEEQLALREAYGHYLDTLPPTCHLEQKVERFRQWLAERGVAYGQGGKLSRIRLV
jgi:hypothetical protein